MQTLLKVFVTAGLLAFVSGCVTKVVVLDSNADVVRLGANVRGDVYIWQSGSWVKTGKTHLPEGWYAGPPPK